VGLASITSVMEEWRMQAFAAQPIYPPSLADAAAGQHREFQSLKVHPRGLACSHDLRALGCRHVA